MVVEAQQYASHISIAGKSTYRFSNNLTDYKVQLHGDIKVNEQDTRILSISPDGYLAIEKKNFGNTRALTIESDAKGKLSYEYYEGRKKLDFKPEGEEWLSEILIFPTSP